MSEDKSQADAGGEAPAESNDPDQLKTALEKSKSEYLYLLAEFDTYRRNAIKERSDLTKYGSERFVRDFLNIFDDFERALEAPGAAENTDSFHTGVRLIATEIRSLLQRFGIEEVPAEGEPFDPNKHEALGSEATDATEPGHILRVFKKAYKMHDKLIRPAQVIVAKAKE